MNLYDATIPIFTKFLGNIDRWVERSIAYAQERKFDPEVYVGLRLAPDQFTFGGQIQAACDAAKYTAARLTGKEPPAHPDVEKTLDELRARMRTVTAYLESFSREEFAGADERMCQHGFMRGKAMRGGDYLDHYALPNFHFHVTHAYAILRHAGVPLGKLDFIGTLPLR